MHNVFVSLHYLAAFMLLLCTPPNMPAGNNGFASGLHPINLQVIPPSLNPGRWKLLFDGSSMKGWRTFQNKKADSWSVKDGVLYCKPAAPDKKDLRSDIITTERFENFELSTDWKISPQGNSGILYMVNEEVTGAHLSGPEYQIIDDLNFPQRLEDWQKTGANYAMNPAPGALPNPAGTWNNTRIIVKKGHVEHWLNGKKIVEYELWTEKWKQEKATGKWKDAPAYGLTKKGHIALQDHGSEAWFRNIKIREL